MFFGDAWSPNLFHNVVPNHGQDVHPKHIAVEPPNSAYNWHRCDDKDVLVIHGDNETVVQQVSGLYQWVPGQHLLPGQNELWASVRDFSVKAHDVQSCHQAPRSLNKHVHAVARALDKGARCIWNQCALKHFLR